MNAYFDTSAIVPLLVEEPHSKMAQIAVRNAESTWAWRWAEVETEAALVRRKASPLAWRNWRILKGKIRWLESSKSLSQEICRFNREVGLRAADAGHLFIFERTVAVIEDLTLVTFDKEMTKAADELGFTIFSPSEKEEKRPCR